MADMGPFYAYKETRLNLDPATESSTISIRLPSHSGSTWTSKQTKQSSIAEIPIAEDEGQFKQKHLASAASIYHRQYHKSPRSFLWRVLEDGKVLSIRAVDVSKQTNAVDSNITLRLAFQDTVKSGCIAFSDSSEHDVLSAFVLTEQHHLYTLSLRPDYFVKASSTEDNVADWCKLHSSSAFAFKKPHRMVALSADELLVSLIDGSLLRLTRKSGGDGSEWKETHYSEGSFRQNITSMIPFQRGNTMAYGKLTLQLSTATSIASPFTEINGIPYTFMVSLDHKLRVWNLQTGRIAYSGDILDLVPESNEAAKPVIDPSYSQLVKVYDDNDDTPLCVTYSPLGTGEFKFWNVEAAIDGTLDVTDLFPSNNMVPRTPTTDLWTLADFSVVLDRSKVSTYILWVLWKNNTTYRIQKLEFRGGSINRVRNAWSTGWEAMAAETLRDAALPSILPGDHADGTDKWLEFILTPGRFTAATIETGLAIYGRGLGAKGVARRFSSLAESMCSTISSTVSLGRTSDGEMDYEVYRKNTDEQWRRFYRLLREIDKQRGEALSLVVDPQGAMPWVVLADGIAAVRECSGLERIWHNQETVQDGAEHVAALVIGAAALRDSFSDQMLHNFDTLLLGELFEEPSLIDPARMRTFYDKCDFANQIGDEEYAQLQSNLGGSFKDVTPQVYEALLELMSASQEIDRRSKPLPNTEFGNKLILKGVQETVELHRNICLDQLALLILIEVEINHGEDGIQFETAVAFGHLIKILKRLEHINWLARTQISLPLPLPRERSGSVTESSGTLAKKPTPSVETVTVLEGVLRHLFGFDSQNNITMPQALTEVIIQVCAPDSEFEAPTAVTQCFLLQHGRPDLAMEFSRFCGFNSFSIYVKGRACLASNDAFAASTLFKKAAFGIGVPDPRKRDDFQSAGYLNQIEKNLLNAGLAEYYSHIVALYDKEKIYSYVIDFARLSLQFIKPGNSNLQQSQLRTEMHSRLFNAAIQTSRYDLAHSILALHTDSALQHSSLRTLITKMCELSCASQLISLPFLGLQDTVDEILAQKCQSIVDVTVGVPYHKILYSWRIKRSDFRGAAAISHERLQRLLQSGDGDRALGEDGLETPVTRQYLSLINALSCVDPKQAWIFSEEQPKKTTSAVKPQQPKRTVVTLEDIRKEYQAELDRIAAIENNQFAFAGGDEMEVDML